MIKSVRYKEADGYYDLKVVMTQQAHEEEWNDYLIVNCFTGHVFVYTDQDESFELTMPLVKNPVTKASVEYLQAMSVDCRSNCSHFQFYEEAIRVLETIKLHWH